MCSSRRAPGSADGSVFTPRSGSLRSPLDSSLQPEPAPPSARLARLGLLRRPRPQVLPAGLQTGPTPSRRVAGQDPVLFGDRRVQPLGEAVVAVERWEL